MKAFLVTESEILDPSVLAAYIPRVREALKAAGGRPAVISSIGGRVVPLVGEAVHRRSTGRTGAAMTTFEDETLRALRDAHEIAIRTEKHPASAIVIWIAVADEEVFVRSARGAKGRWYRDLLTDPRTTLEVVGRRLAVQAIATSDPQSIDRASRAYLRKYEPSPYAQSIVKADVLPTTLRLEPR